MVAVHMDSENAHAMMNCPGCDLVHAIHVGDRIPGKPTWDFNGNLEKPTFSPSLLVKYNWGDDEVAHVCHSFIRDGKWQFLNDCTHSLAGQTVPVIAWDNK